MRNVLGVELEKRSHIQSISIRRIGREVTSVSGAGNYIYCGYPWELIFLSTHAFRCYVLILKAAEPDKKTHKIRSRVVKGSTFILFY